MAATYESWVRVDDPEHGVSEHHISMNHPMHYRGYIFFQASFVEGTPMMSIFSVARAPGLPLVYLGVALIGTGVIWMFYVKPYLARRQAARALAAHRERESRNEAPSPPADPSLLALLLPSPLQAGPELDPLRRIAIQEGGRIEALRHLRAGDRAPPHRGQALRLRAREGPRAPRSGCWPCSPTPRAGAGRRSSRSPTRACARRRASPEAPGPLYSFQELVAPRRLPEGGGSGAREAAQGPRGPARPHRARDLDLYESLTVLSGIFSGESLRIVPAPRRPQGHLVLPAPTSRRRTCRRCSA